MANSIICGVRPAPSPFRERRRSSAMKTIWLEKVYPYLIAIALSTLWAWAGAPFPDKGDALFGAAVTVASVFGGFLVASKAVILGLKDSAIFEKLRESSYMDVFIGYLRVGINASIGLVVISMIGFFLEQDSVAPLLVKVFCFFWLLTGLIALLTYWRVSNLLFKMLKHV